MKTLNLGGFASAAFLATGFLFGEAYGQAPELAKPIVTDQLVFEERGGEVAVEAEHFVAQRLNDVRSWYRTSGLDQPKASDDADPPHAEGASGGAYVECLPDTRHNHDHRLIAGENFSNQAGQLAVLEYLVHFNTPGRYYVWVRAYSTGTEDNGLHVGLDGEWPASGQRLQWCEGKRGWRWESKQRTAANHCGEPYKIYLDVAEAGLHRVHFSMREDGFEFDKFILTQNRTFARPEGEGPDPVAKQGRIPQTFAEAGEVSSLLVEPRSAHGGGELKVTGELKQWHKVSVTLDGPFAHERDERPNPFRDYRMTVRFTHLSGAVSYDVPGFFAADGDAANSSAESGTAWRAHFAPDRTGTWTARVSFVHGKDAALDADANAEAWQGYHGASISFVVAPSDKLGRDLRAKGRLQYVGKRYLQFAGSGEYFLKAGADAPETFLGYADFDGTIARKKNVPLKTWEPHVSDWREGDPTWQDGKGKGMIGALNYLASKGCNVFSFLTYNAGGDGDNVWPFVARDDKFHYDCSKLDQWGVIFDHGTRMGHYLHFKMQETEMDDNRRGEGTRNVPTSLDGGALGAERKLYCRELVARFGHALALNWNLGEENTQSTAELKAMASYIQEVDPYNHIVVVHTFPNQQDQVYRPLLGEQSVLKGMSLQNSHIRDTHWQVVKWVDESTAAGDPWVVAFDESGSAKHGQVPDWGYEGFRGVDSAGEKVYSQHEVRRQTLWGTLMGGGAGVEYYFGYRVPQNDLICEDWRSRDQSWDYCRIALQFFARLPFAEMKNANALVGNPKHENSVYCFAQPGDVYVVYVPTGGGAKLDLTDVEGEFSVQWFNPRSGGELQVGTKRRLVGGLTNAIGLPPTERKEDWAAVIRRVSE